MCTKIILQLLTHNILSTDAKHLDGRRFTDASVQTTYRATLSSGSSRLFRGLVTNPRLLFSTRARRSSSLLKRYLLYGSQLLIKMREIAEAYIADTIKNAVVTVLATSMTPRGTP